MSKFPMNPDEEDEQSKRALTRYIIASVDYSSLKYGPITQAILDSRPRRIRTVKASKASKDVEPKRTLTGRLVTSEPQPQVYPFGIRAAVPPPGERFLDPSTNTFVYANRYYVLGSSGYRYTPIGFLSADVAEGWWRRFGQKEFGGSTPARPKWDPVEEEWAPDFDGASNIVRASDLKAFSISQDGQAHFDKCQRLGTSVFGEEES